MANEKYDDASWHYDTTPKHYSEEERSELGATHIGLIYKWCILKDFSSEEMIKHFAPQIAEVKSNKLTGTAFLLYNDGKFVSDFLNDKGQAFISAYYGNEGYYYADLSKFDDKIAFGKFEKDVDYVLFSKMIDMRYSDFLAKGASAVREEVVKSKPEESFLIKLFKMFKK